MMTARTLIASAAIALCLSGLSTAAKADGAWACDTLTFSGASYIDCVGSFSPAGGQNDTSANVASKDWIETWAVSQLTQSKDNDKTLLTTSTMINAISGTPNKLQFSVSLNDPFIIAIKLGQEWSAYLFDTDVQAGTTWTFAPPVKQGMGLSHASLYTGNISELVPQPAVPEPATYAMFLAGLGLLGAARLRRSRG